MSPAPTPDELQLALRGRVSLALGALKVSGSVGRMSNASNPAAAAVTNRFVADRFVTGRAVDGAGRPAGGADRATNRADEDPGAESLAALVRRLVETVRERNWTPGGATVAWLAYVALAGVYPAPTRLARFVRNIDLSDDADLVRVALTDTSDDLAYYGRATRGIRLLPPGQMLIDVTFCASYGHNTGIQRVVRNLLPHWGRQNLPIMLARWSPAGGGFVDLTDEERRRVLDWRSGMDDAPREATLVRELLVPWGGVGEEAPTLFLPEVPAAFEVAELSAVAESSGIGVHLLGYDTIPIGSADTFVPDEPERFARYLGVVKHARTVIAISHSAANEFSGFVSTLPAQGLVGPRVVAVPLATEAGGQGVTEQKRSGEQADSTTHNTSETDAPSSIVTADELPLVLCVGSHEPRKNQEAVLAAAEVLFHQGLRFRTVFVGAGSGETISRFDQQVRSLVKRGMAVESHRRLGDDELWQLYRQARFTVLLSLHEGFGLPIVESTSFGTPVLTSAHGSLAEVARLGGCFTVDPRDDAAIVEGMRQMLCDNELIARLCAEIRALPTRSWSQYADEVWGELQEAPDAH